MVAVRVCATGHYLVADLENSTVFELVEQTGQRKVESKALQRVDRKDQLTVAQKESALVA